MKTLLLILLLPFAVVSAGEHWSEDPKIDAMQGEDWSAVTHVWPEILTAGTPMRLEMERVMKEIADVQKDNPKIYSVAARTAWQNLAIRAAAAKPAPAPAPVPVQQPQTYRPSTIGNLPKTPEPLDPVAEELRKMRMEQMMRETQRRTEEARREQRERMNQR